MPPEELEEIEAIIENGVGEIYKGFYRLRKAGLYQEEYDNMDSLFMMLMQDRRYLAETYGVIT
jgi:hypothetical protein